MHKDLDEALGATLRNLRRTNRLSQQAAAKELGVSQPTLSRWENGTVSMDTVNVACAATLYGSSAARVYSTRAVQEATQGSVPDHVRARAQSLAQRINQRQGR